MKNAQTLQAENHLLRTSLCEKDALLSQQTSLIENKEKRIHQLEALLKEAMHQRFGASSEKLITQEQAQLFDEAEAYADDVQAGLLDDDETVEIPAHARKKQKRDPIHEDIPRIEKHYDLSDAEKICPHDGTALKAIGEETHEQLDIIPAKVQAIRHIRKKYACPCCEQYVVTAKKPKQAIEKGIASASLLAAIATQKYADGLPLYRQEAIFKRLGVEIDRTSMANWMIRCGHLVQPIINRLYEHLLELPVLHMDETTVQVLQEPGKAAASQSYMWVMASAQSQASPAVLFHYASSRSSAIPLARLNSFEGALMVDGYEGYQKACTEQGITRLGCWAHARRKFMEAKRQQAKGKTGKADQALAFIQKLYRIERDAHDKTDDERFQLRQQQAKPVLDKLRQWLEKTLQHTPPKTALGKAAHYLHNQWPRLECYLDDGAYPIDNNRAENSIRPFVVGRKNWLFSNSQSGARASANLYSLIETAKLNGLEPHAYLLHLFTQLPNAETVDDIDACLPWLMKGHEEKKETASS